MSLERQSPAIMRFGVFEVDLRAGELRKQGVRIKLQEQPFHVLTALLQRPGEVVTREELRSQIWPEDTFVDFDNSLNTAINKLRDALGDSAEAPRFIETLPRRGYRFIGSVIPQSPPLRIPWWRNRLATVIGGLIFAFVILSAGVYRHRLSFAVSSTQQLVHTRITFRGDAVSPAISPDGKFVAYMTDSNANDNKLMMQSLAGGPSLELFHGGVVPGFRWSPDGSELAVSTLQKQASVKRPIVVIVSRLGGAPRLLAENLLGYLCWSPDGSQIVIAAPTGEGGIWSVNKLTGTIKEMHAPVYQWLFDVDCSPKTGMLLLLTRTSEKYQIWTMKPDGSEQRKLIEDRRKIKSARWSPTGDAVYYFRRAGDTADLLKLIVSGQSAESSVLVRGLEAGEYFTLSADGSQLEYTREHDFSNLWLVELPVHGAAARVQKKPLTSGTMSYDDPSISPDGRWVAFSIRGNVYKMMIDGGQPVQLTFFNEVKSRSPAWSPDGQRIAFICDQGGTSRVWVVTAEGGTPHSLDKTNASDTNFQLSWFPNREILYQQPGLHNIRRLNVETEEEKSLLSVDSTGSLFSKPILSPDGKKIAIGCLRPEGSGVWVITPERRSEEFLYPGYTPLGWSADGAFIYVYRTGGGEILRIGLGESKELQPVVSVPGFLSFSSSTISPDGRKIIANVEEDKADIWMMRNFDPPAESGKHSHGK